MTIKRTWIDRKGKVHEKYLRPRYEERISMIIDDAEGKGYFTFRNGIARVVSDDEILFEEKGTFLARLFDANINKKEGKIITYKKELINSLATGRYSSRDEIIGRRKQKISFNWEPTLPAAARK